MNKISDLRQKFGLSQKELAEILGVAQNTVSNWELGKRQVSSEKLISLASLFKVSVDELIKNDRPSQGPNPLDTDDKTSGLEQILACYEKLNAKGQDRAEQIMLDLIEIPRYRQGKTFTFRAARSESKTSAPEEVSQETVDKLKKIKGIKNEKDLQ